MLFFIYLTMKNKDNLNIIKSYLPFSLKKIIDIIPDNLQEIRLRANRPAALCTPRKVYYIKDDFSLTDALSGNLIKTTSKEITEAFSAICNYSVYSKQNEIINGYLTLKGGNRAGICGTSIVQNSSIVNIRDITSINLRVVSEMIGCSDKLLNIIDEIDSGVLICGAPCSGKTTLLHDIARKLSYSHNVALIDSRGELAAVYAGVAQNDVGMCDILDCYSKCDGFEHAVRCLSSDIIVCDEIGTSEDISAIENASKSGVAVIASAHCRSKSELESKPRFKRLLKNSVFKNIVFLNGKKNIGQVSKVISSYEFN